MNNYITYLLFLFYGLLLSYQAKSEEPIYTDATVKAAYVLNISNFLSFPKKAEVVDICIVGDDLVGASIVSLKKQSRRPLDHIRISKREPNSSFSVCEIIYISSERADQINHVLFKVSQLPILTISNVSNFARNGGMIEFKVLENKVRLIINKGNIARNKIKISAKVFSIAEEIYD